MYSYHIFLFPFRWEIQSEKTNTNAPLSDRIVTIEEIATKMANSTDWKKFSFEFKIENGAFNTYNEYAYFHDYARDVLCLKKTSSVSVAQYFYEKNSAIYSIKIKDDFKPFELEIEDILLNFYESGIGVLSFHLCNKKEKDFNRILKINEYGRRIYPQFLGKDNLSFTNDTKYNFLAEEIMLSIEQKGKDGEVISKSIREGFKHYDNLDNINSKPFILPKHISELLGTQFKGEFDEKQAGDFILYPILDDRMFVMSFLFDTKRITEFSQFNMQGNEYNWQSNKEWYRYLFVDDSTASCHSELLIRQQLSASTYDRWVANFHEKDGAIGQIFGASSYSFVMILANSGWLNQNLVIYHFKNIYFQMAQLSLVQRATVLNYGAEVSRISEDLKLDGKMTGKTAQRISDLYRSYIRFINKIYFREITPQEQGIELYNLLQDRLHIKSDVEDLDDEISELNAFVEMYQEKERNDRLETLTKVAAIIGVMSLILSFFGLGYFGTDAKMLKIGTGSFEGTNSSAFISVIYIFGILGFFGILYSVFQFFYSKNKR